MIFNSYKSRKVVQILFKSYLFGNLFLIFSIIYGFINGAEILPVLASLIYLSATTLLTLNRKFHKSQFALFFCFHSFLYLNIPAAFIVLNEKNYIYGESIESIPFLQSEYQQSLPWGLLYLTICWVAVWLGIVTNNSKKKIIDQNLFLKINLSSILILGAIVFVVSLIDIQNFTSIRIGAGERVNSILVFIFFDYAYLILCGLIFFIKCNENKNIEMPNKINLNISIIFILFTLLFFEAGAKAAILAVFTWLVLFPVAFSREFNLANISFVNLKAIMMIALLSLPMFYFSMIMRMNIGMGISTDLNMLLIGVDKFEIIMFNDIIKLILYRFCQGGLDQFLLIFHSFIINNMDLNTSFNFINYLVKNSLNLILPGTPFAESYVPSSQLFHQVIDKNLVGLNYGVNPDELIKSLNTQPYTIFGVFMIIFGIISPMMIYILTYLFINIFKRINDIFVKSALLFFFIAIFSSYGFETAIGNAVHLYVSILFMYIMLKILSWISFNLLKLKINTKDK
jgi:hypothetical protein